MSLAPINDPTQNPKEGTSAVYVAKVRGQIISQYRRVVIGARNTWERVRQDYSKAPARR